MRLGWSYFLIELDFDLQQFQATNALQQFTSLTPAMGFVPGLGAEVTPRLLDGAERDRLVGFNCLLRCTNEFEQSLSWSIQLHND